MEGKKIERKKERKNLTDELNGKSVQSIPYTIDAFYTSFVHVTFD